MSGQSWEVVYKNLPEITELELYDLVTKAVLDTGKQFGVGMDRGRKYALNIANILGKYGKPMSLGEIIKEMLLLSTLNVAKSSRKTTVLRCLRMLQHVKIVKRWPVFEGDNYRRKDYYLSFRLVSDNEEGNSIHLCDVIIKLLNAIDDLKREVKEINQKLNYL